MLITNSTTSDVVARLEADLADAKQRAKSDVIGTRLAGEIDVKRLAPELESAKRLAAITSERRAAEGAARQHEQAIATAAESAQRQRDADDLKARLEAQYMRMPGATRDAFEASYPDLLADHQRRQMDRQAAAADEASDRMRRSIRSRF